MTLRVSEIYASIQGESTFAGIPCTFVRLTGCPLRCKWCDTAHAFTGGEDLEIKDILEKVQSLGLPLVEVTGGEPMAQADTPKLLQALLDAGHKVLMETSGSEPLNLVPEEVRTIMDIKCPGSGMSEKMCWENLAVLRPHDEVKFVLAHRADFDWALAVVADYRLDERFQVLFSCAFGLLKPQDLAAWIVERRANVRLQLQQHKYIWSPRAKGV